MRQRALFIPCMASFLHVQALLDQRGITVNIATDATTFEQSDIVSALLEASSILAANGIVVVVVTDVSSTTDIFINTDFPVRLSYSDFSVATDGAETA